MLMLPMGWGVRGLSAWPCVSPAEDESVGEGEERGHVTDNADNANHGLGVNDGAKCPK